MINIYFFELKGNKYKVERTLYKAMYSDRSHNYTGVRTRIRQAGHA
jgi:hypothetical protein